MKSFVGNIINKAIKATAREKKVSPTIKSVKPTKDISGSVKRVTRDVTSKRIDDVSKVRNKMKTGNEVDFWHWFVGKSKVANRNDGISYYSGGAEDSFYPGGIMKLNICICISLSNILESWTQLYG